MIFNSQTGQTAIQDPDKDRVGQKIEQAAESLPLAGPHDRPELTNYDACPGCGMFPAQKPSRGFESDPGAG